MEQLRWLNHISVSVFFLQTQCYWSSVQPSEPIQGGRWGECQHVWWMNDKTLTHKSYSNVLRPYYSSEYQLSCFCQVYLAHMNFNYIWKALTLLLIDPVWRTRLVNLCVPYFFEGTKPWQMKYQNWLWMRLWEITPSHYVKTLHDAHPLASPCMVTYPCQKSL